MNRNKKTLIHKHWSKILVLVIAVSMILSSLFFLNIGIVNAEWNAHSSIEGFQINNATGELKETLYIYIDNTSLYAEEIRSILLEKLASYNTGTKQLIDFNETKEMMNASFVGIHITQNIQEYYPWSATNKYTVFYYFSDIGNTNYYLGFKTAESMYDNPPVIFNASDGDQLLNIGDITIEGLFSGMFSKPRMEERTIEYIANEIVKQVKQ